MDIWIWWISKDFHIQNGARMITAAHFEYTYIDLIVDCAQSVLGWVDRKNHWNWISPIKSLTQLTTEWLDAKGACVSLSWWAAMSLVQQIPQIPEILDPCGPCGPWVISEVGDCSSVLHQICPIPVPWNRVWIWEDSERLQGQRNGCFEAVREPYQESSVLRENSMVSLCTYS